MSARYALLALLCLAAGGAAQSQELPTPLPPDPYRIQPGDVLAISVWKEPELQGVFLVRPDGGLSFPLMGDIAAERMTIEQLRQALVRGLKKYVPDPSVTVSLKELGGNRIYVVGKVNHPGEFPFSKPLDVMQAISLAGGTTPFASIDEIRILRRKSGGNQDAIRFRMGDVARGQGLEQNILLQSGDTIVVP